MKNYKEKPITMIPSYEDIQGQGSKGDLKGAPLYVNEGADLGPQSPVAAALQEAKCIAERLDNSIEKLYAVLRPVISEHDVEHNKSVIDLPSHSPLGKEICALICMLQHSNNIIDDILGSVEI